MFLTENNVLFKEDLTSYMEKDNYDFILPNNVTIDVKTRTKKYHTRTLEMVEQFNRNPKDIYVSVRLYPESNTGNFLGWITKKDILQINRIENQGYLDNYVIYDNELRSMDKLYEYLIAAGLVLNS